MKRVVGATVDSTPTDTLETTCRHGRGEWGKVGLGEAAAGHRTGLRFDRIERKRPWYDPKRLGKPLGDWGLEVKQGHIFIPEETVAGDDA